MGQLLIPFTNPILWVLCFHSPQGKSSLYAEKGKQDSRAGLGIGRGKRRDDTRKKKPLVDVDKNDNKVEAYPDTQAHKEGEASDF